MKVANFEQELPLAGFFEQVSLNRIAALARDVVARSTAHTDDQLTSWQLIFLQSKVNGCAYRGEDLPQRKWEWPKNTWLQERLSQLRPLEPRAEQGSCGALGN
ncbi:MAG: hypothetical protein ACREQK_02310 [Candidatus Binatia bacterium]